MSRCLCLCLSEIFILTAPASTRRGAFVTKERDLELLRIQLFDVVMVLASTEFFFRATVPGLSASVHMLWWVRRELMFYTLTRA